MTPIEELQRFIRDHDDWQERLGKDPYNIRAPKIGNLRLFTYTQGATDFSIPMCRVCRGLILEEGTWKVVSAQFKKFFNYFDRRYFDGIGQKSFDTYLVEKKYDGSLIRFYWYDGEWRIGTNGSIDASRIDLKFEDKDTKNFVDAVHDILGEDYDKLVSRFNRSFTYIFELIHPYQPITINYEDEKSLIFHGITKNDEKFIELDVHGYTNPRIDDIDSIKYPEIEHVFYHEGELDYEQLAMDAESKEGLVEGYIIKRVNYLGIVIDRVKIKIDDYLSRSDLALYSYDKLVFEKFIEGTLYEFLDEKLSPYQMKLVKISMRKIDLIRQEFIEVLKEFKAYGVTDKKQIALNIIPELKHPFKNCIFQFVDYMNTEEYNTEILYSDDKHREVRRFVITIFDGVDHPSKFKKWWEHLEENKNRIYFPKVLDKILYDEEHYNELD